MKQPPSPPSPPEEREKEYYRSCGYWIKFEVGVDIKQGGSISGLKIAAGVHHSSPTDVVLLTYYQQLWWKICSDLEVQSAGRGSPSVSSSFLP